MQRRLLLLFAAAYALSIAACSSGTMPPTAVAPALHGSRAATTRGGVIWMRRVATFTPAELSGNQTGGSLGFAESVITALGGAPKCAVRLYAIKYATIGVMGDPATASAGFFIPAKPCKGPFTLIGYGQGTNVVKAIKITDPSKINVQPQVLSAIFAAHGYAVAATDYLGLGYSDYSYQPYVVVTAEASAVIDAMRAVRAAATTLRVPLSGKVFLTGHSQGGQSALGTQKVIEANDASEFDLIADSPSSGPYALTKTMLDGIRKPGEDAAIYATYILTAYEKTYQNVYQRASDVFRYPYASYVTNLLPVKTVAEGEALQGKTLPISIRRLLHASFIQTFSMQPDGSQRTDVRANDLLDGWKPQAPVYFCGGRRDPEVEFKNSILAYRYFKREGAAVSLLDVNQYIPSSVPITEYHDAVLVVCHTLERVAVLDAARGPARTGVWPSSLRGQMGPFTIPAQLP
ncbi:MAG: alpha/beta hydrolase [Candidatus Eremiobacteraeota bacterium]|nr:alpha/beta hydrolase [Candidatus Eremiobacteraeota bacterium]